MKTRQWMKLVGLAVAVLAIGGVFTVVACGPAAPAPPVGGGDAGVVTESVSVPVTGAPFVLQQSGDGDGTGGQGESTEEPTAEPTEEPTPTQYVSPTADRSLCSVTHNFRDGSVIGTRCPPDGNSSLSYGLRKRYNEALMDNDDRGLSGRDMEFSNVYVHIHVASEAVDSVVQFLEGNGAYVGYFGLDERDSSRGSVSGRISVGLIPGLVQIEGVKHVVEDKSIDGDLHEWITIAHHIVDDELWFRYEGILSEDHRHSRRSAEAVSYPVVRILITVWEAKYVDTLVKYLNANGAANVVGTKLEGDWGGSGNVEADVSLGLIGDISRVTGVREIVEVKPTSRVPGGGEGRGTTAPSFRAAPTSVSAVVSMQADHWHRAGFTGAGVEVAVIDSGFAEFRTRVLPLLSQPVRYLCYSAPDPFVIPDPPVEGVISAATAAVGGNPEGSFDNCDSPGSLGVPVIEHGTAVSEALAEISPDVELYVSNPYTQLNKGQVVKWLTSGIEDNVIGVAEYNVAGNDDFDIKVINRSGSSRWDGPGDGSSPFYNPNERSWLNLVDDAVGRVVLWVNSAGNRGHWTWFSHDPSFGTGLAGPVRRFLKFDGSDGYCNSFELSAAGSYSFPLRWWDSWPGADTDLDLLLYPKSGGVSMPVNEVRGVDGGLDPQSGDALSHYPREFLEVGVGSVPSGQYCLAVELKSGVAPEWVQLQVWRAPEETSLLFSTDMHSLNNASDSANDGMLSVGLTNAGGARVRDESARDPAPWEEGRKALDLVSDGSHPRYPSVFGSSAAAPRVAGLAALVIQALGAREQFDEPTEVAQYMKDFGSTRTDCVHDWGCGFAMLPPLDPPTDVTLGSNFHGCRASDANVRITFDPPTNGNPDVTVPYFVELRKDGDADAGPLVLGGGSLDRRHDVRIPAGENYVAEVHTCVPGVDGEPVCGVASAPSAELSVSGRVCRPEHFDVIPGAGMMTLRWDAQPDATEYEVEQVDADGNPVVGSSVTTTDQHLVFSNLADLVFYRYRLRAKGPSGTTSWSETLRNHTGNALGFILPLRDFQEFTSLNRLGQYDAVFGWLYGGGAALHEMQVREVDAETWTQLSSDPAVTGDGPRVFFTRDGYQGGNFGNSFMYGAVAGLIPGTEYEIRVRGHNGELESPWTETAKFTTPGRRPVEDEDRPPVPEGLEVIVNAGEPFPRVVLGWDTADEDYLHEIRVMGGGIDKWRRLPHQPAGWSSEYSVQYPTDGQAFITNLIPGTEYHFAVRAARERNSRDALAHSPWSEVTTLTTAGDRPANAPGEATAPAPKAPPKDLMAEVDGTTVNLSWTAATNPNYVRQVLRRRDVSVVPEDWTEITVGLDGTAYSDTGLSSGVTYRYRVRAYKSNGHYGQEKEGFADAVIP